MLQGAPNAPLLVVARAGEVERQGFARGPDPGMVGKHLNIYTALHCRYVGWWRKGEKRYSFKAFKWCLLCGNGWCWPAMVEHMWGSGENWRTLFLGPDEEYNAFRCMSASLLPIYHPHFSQAPLKTRSAFAKLLQCQLRSYFDPQVDDAAPEGFWGLGFKVEGSSL